NFDGCRECHIRPDWLLIYDYENLEKGEKQLLLIRTGSHSELLE
ncbi:MAG: type II toxin-antitoxin system YafQ family toxin, partial [Oscillospiraceae bacterium]|nr:type II toxin-antitoxin system YafQ family toxin [Oscillospiraceae bacterium]